MSILQEYENIRKQIGEEKYQAIEIYLSRHAELFLSDIYYNKQENEKFEKWYKKYQYNRRFEQCIKINMMMM